MRKLFKNLIVILGLVLTLSIPVMAQAPIEPDRLATLDNKGEMLEYVELKALQYNVSKSLMICLISHENRYWEPTLQSGIITNGKREQSFGLSQINIPSNPNVSLGEATDPKFAIDFMASHIKQGHASMWSTLHYCK